MINEELLREGMSLRLLEPLRRRRECTSCPPCAGQTGIGLSVKEIGADR